MNKNSKEIRCSFCGAGKQDSLMLIAGLLVGLPVLAVFLWRMRIPEIRDIAGMVRGR